MKTYHVQERNCLRKTSCPFNFILVCVQYAEPWVGEIKNEQLHSALEKLSEDDLMLVSLYVYEGFDTVEISKVFGTTKQNISKKIRRITNFIKNFQIKVV